MHVESVAALVSCLNCLVKGLSLKKIQSYPNLELNFSSSCFIDETIPWSSSLRTKAIKAARTGLPKDWELLLEFLVGRRSGVLESGSNSDSKNGFIFGERSVSSFGNLVVSLTDSSRCCSVNRGESRAYEPSLLDTLRRKYSTRSKPLDELGCDESCSSLVLVLLNLTNWSGGECTSTNIKHNEVIQVTAVSDISKGLDTITIVICMERR